MRSVFTSAPSNIALIKYMGKAEVAGNRPTNASLSYSLEHLRTFIRITEIEKSKEDAWQPLEKDQDGQKLFPIQLSEKGRDKFLKHFQRLKNLKGDQKNYLIESANNFPSDCGLASSASSFAALTLAANEILDLDKSASELSLLSRQGSGSSCRSLFGPWSLWRSEGAEPISLGSEDLLHQVVVVESQVKAVSSSEAHIRVLTSDLFQGRVQRAEERLALALNLIREKQWALAYELFWSEFWDMHALFHTSKPHFSYMTSDSLKVLQFIESIWIERKDGPWVTMDAGANVHLLYRPEQRDLYNEILGQLKSSYMVIGSLK